MKIIKKYIFILVLFVTIPNCLYSNVNNDIECLQIFNNYIYNKLLELNRNNIDVTSRNINIIFEISFSEDGNIDSVFLARSNLKCFDIDEYTLISSLIDQKMPCFINVFYKEKILPDKIIVVYNTKILQLDE